LKTETIATSGDDIGSLMKDTAKLREIITKRGAMEILIPLCCSTVPVRYMSFRKSMKGFSSKTLAARLKELEREGILQRQAYNEIPPRVEYMLTSKQRTGACGINHQFDRSAEKMVKQMNLSSFSLATI